MVTLDICSRRNPTICTDLLEWDPSATYAPDYFDYVHASVPCENYSICKSTGCERALEQADALVEKTLQIFAYFSSACWTVETPATSLLWQRAVARLLFEQIAKTNHCRYKYPYRKNTWFANNL